MNQRERDLLSLAIQKPKVIAEWLYERETQLAERDAEIERLKHLLENAKKTIFSMHEICDIHEKREAALLAFVEAFDRYDKSLGYSDLKDLEEAREQLRGVIDGMD